MRNRGNATTWMRKGRRNDTEPTLLQALCDRGGDDGNDGLNYLQSDPFMVSTTAKGQRARGLPVGGSWNGRSGRKALEKSLSTEWKAACALQSTTGHEIKKETTMPTFSEGTPS